MINKKKIPAGKSKSDAKGDVAGQESTSYLTPSGIRTFIQEVQAEFNKIVWPAKKVTAGLTGFVLLLVVILSIYLGSVDLLLGKMVSSVLG
jgi:preprotein translocase subunit SecE